MTGSVVCLCGRIKSGAFYAQTERLHAPPTPTWDRPWDRPWDRGLQFCGLLFLNTLQWPDDHGEFNLLKWLSGWLTAPLQPSRADLRAPRVPERRSQQVLDVKGGTSRLGRFIAQHVFHQPPRGRKLREITRKRLPASDSAVEVRLLSDRELGLVSRRSAWAQTSRPGCLLVHSPGSSTAPLAATLPGEASDAVFRSDSLVLKAAERAQYRLLVTSACALFAWVQTRPAFSQLTRWRLLLFKKRLKCIIEDEPGADWHSCFRHTLN